MMGLLDFNDDDGELWRCNRPAETEEDEYFKLANLQAGWLI